MKEQTKRHDNEALDQVQQGNESWWSENPMTYDWEKSVVEQRFSREWFEVIDQRFVRATNLFAHTSVPFGHLIPFDKLDGARVLEIGCGMGLHTSLMAAAGADVTAVDLSPTSIEATSKRMALKGLSANLQLMDAQNLAFDSNSFDFVWSWGVIHHSACTAMIVKNIARVLKPAGETRVMVYNRDSSAAHWVLIKHLLRAKFMRQSLDQSLWSVTDGYTARYYSRDQFDDLFRAFFSDVSTEICGQEADAVPLPARIRRHVVPRVGKARMRTAQARWGSFLFLTARNSNELESPIVPDQGSA